MTGESIRAAREAIGYVHQFVKKASTDPNNSRLELDERLHIADGLKDTREYTEETPLYELTRDHQLREYLSRVHATKKYSLGNCEEMSTVALSFIVENKRQLDAKMFSLERGDHVVLIIGKDIDFEDLVDCARRGEHHLLKDVSVCDPLSGECYPFLEYPQRIKAYYYDEDEVLCRSYDFEEDYHTLAPFNLSANDIRNRLKAETHLEIHERFINKIQYLENRLREYTERMSETEDPSVKSQIKEIQSRLSTLRSFESKGDAPLDTQKFQHQKALHHAIKFFSKGYELTHPGEGAFKREASLERELSPLRRTW